MITDVEVKLDALNDKTIDYIKLTKQQLAVDIETNINNLKRKLESQRIKLLDEKTSEIKIWAGKLADEKIRMSESKSSA